VLVVLSEGLAHIRGAHTGYVVLSKNTRPFGEMVTCGQLQEKAYGPNVLCRVSNTAATYFWPAKSVCFTTGYKAINPLATELDIKTVT
jgi:hypothetical protein